MKTTTPQSTRRSFAVPSIAGIIGLACAASVYAQDTLTADGFEGDGTGSFGNWTAAGSAFLKDDAALATTGDFSAELYSGGTITTTNPLPLGSSGYTSVTLTVSAKWVQGSTTRRFQVRYAADGVNFVTLADADIGDTDATDPGKTPTTVTLTVGGGITATNFHSIVSSAYSGEPFTDQAKFQIFYSSNSTAHRVYLDDISITASPEFTGLYWDVNGATDGSGGPSPSGIWDDSTANWSGSPAGDVATSAWSPGGVAVFSAGSDATDPYTVTVAGTQDISGLAFSDGTPTISGGTALRMVDATSAFVGSGLTATIATNLTDDGSNPLLTKTGPGLLVLSGDNSGATGGMAIDVGFVQFNSPASINGTALNISVSQEGTLLFGPAFGGGNIATALLDRVDDASSGTIAADNFTATNFDFATSFKVAAFLGAVGDVSYTGTYTPAGSTYRLGGGGGTLTMANANALTGETAAIVRGNVVLAGANSHENGTTLSAGTFLTLGDDDSLGSGTLTISGVSTLSAQGTVTASNPVAANANFTIAGTGTLSLSGTTTINANRTVTNNNTTSPTTFVDVTRDGTSNRNLVVTGPGDTTITGLVLGTGIMTKNDSGTLVLNGEGRNHGTTASGGTLVLSGSNSSTTQTTLNAATLQLNSDSNGGLASGPLALAQNAGVLQAINADRSIDSLVSLNASPTISGSQSLTINGSLRLNGNRILTNSISGTGKSLNIATIDRTDANNRNMTFGGDGDTNVTGAVDLGTGTLTKNGAGTLTLGGTSTYTGLTTVNNTGALLVNGSIPGAVTVNNTATLGGSGTIGGNVTVTGSANLAPGESVGTLSIGGDLTISAMAAGAGVLFYELGPVAASDRINVTGTLFIGGGVLGFSDFDFTNVGGLEEGVYTLIASGGIDGTLDAGDLEGTIGATEAVLGISGNNIILTIGEPSGTPFELWAGPGVGFDADENGDGVANGLAFLLGAADPDASALDLLPTVTEDAGSLVLSFSMLNAANRGASTLSVEYSNDLGITDPWASAGVPATSSTVNDVVFTITPNGTLNEVVAAIPASKAGGTGKLFGRLMAEE